MYAALGMISGQVEHWATERRLRAILSGRPLAFVRARARLREDCARLEAEGVPLAASLGDLDKLGVLGGLVEDIALGGFWILAEALTVLLMLLTERAVLGAFGHCDELLALVHFVFQVFLRLAYFLSLPLVRLPFLFDLPDQGLYLVLAAVLRAIFLYGFSVLAANGGERLVHVSGRLGLGCGFECRDRCPLKVWRYWLV